MSCRSLVLGVFLGLLIPLSFAEVQAQEPPSQASCALRGRVLGHQSFGGRPLANAIVSLSSRGRHLTVSADAEGRYLVSHLSPGLWRVRVIHIGYEPMAAAVQIPPRGAVILDLSLRYKPIVLRPIRVQATPVRPLDQEATPPPSELGEIALRALEGSPGIAEGGLAQVVRGLPGNDPSDPQDVLLMRGSAADLKLVLLDGAPVYTPFHMAGLLESFDPQALGGASLFLGGAPTRFDGGLSYILDLRGRSPRRDRIRGDAALDLLTGRLLLEGPLGSNTGFLLGGRAIHDLGTPVLGQGASPYGFGDLLGRLEWTGEGEEELYLTGFWNRESVSLDFPDEAAEVLQGESDRGNAGLFGAADPGEGAWWGNRAVAAGFRGRLGETQAELRVAASRYEAQLPVGDTLPLFAQSRTDRTRFTADFSRGWGEGAVRFGGVLDRARSAYTAMALDSSQVGRVNRVRLQGATVGAYLEIAQPLTRNVSLRGGGRMDHFQEDGSLRLAPRLSLTWMLTDQAALTLAAGRYHQYSNVAAGEIEEKIAPDSSGSSFDDEGPLELAVGSADHLAVSLDQILTPGLRLGLEGFVKEFSGVAGAGGQSLNASGIDLRVAREGHRASGWLGYTLTWFWASDDLLAGNVSPLSLIHI